MKKFKTILALLTVAFLLLSFIACSSSSGGGSSNDSGVAQTGNTETEEDGGDDTGKEENKEDDDDEEKSGDEIDVVNNHDSSDDPFSDTEWLLENGYGGVNCQVTFYDDGTALLINNGLSVPRSSYSVKKNGDSYTATGGENSYTFTIDSLDARQGNVKWPLQKVDKILKKDDPTGVGKKIKRMTTNGTVEVVGECDLKAMVNAFKELKKNKSTVEVKLDLSKASDLTKLEISDTDSVFYGCKNLSGIVLPDSLVRIGRKAFMNCTSLTSITIPANVTSIGFAAFSDCSSLKKVEFSDTSVQWYNGYSTKKDGKVVYENGEPVNVSDPETNARNFVEYEFPQDPEWFELYNENYEPDITTQLW